MLYALNSLTHKRVRTFLPYIIVFFAYCMPVFGLRLDTIMLKLSQAIRKGAWIDDLHTR